MRESTPHGRSSDSPSLRAADHERSIHVLTNWNYDDALLNAVATNAGELSGCQIGRAFIYLGHNNGG